ncbi:MAG: AraC family transcriptional regulator [Myxococcota bacterium]
MLVLLPPHQRCRLESDAALTLDLLLFSRFAVERATKSFGALAEIPRPSFDPRGATWVTRLWHDEEPDGHVPCLLRWLAHRSTLATSLPNPADSIGPGTLRALEAQLEEQIARPLDFAALAETAGLPREPFSRAFKAVLGLAPTRYFTRLRVELAAHRLHHRGSINLDRIALDMGFYDQSHMNRQFKRLLGITPGEYRRQI